MNNIKSRVYSNAVTNIKWAVLAIFVGLVVGVVASSFAVSLNSIIAWRTEKGLLPILFAPLMGPIIILFYNISKHPGGGSTNEVFLAVQDNKPMKLRVAPLIYFGTCATHAVGGSVGREGAALQIGGSIGGKIGLYLKFNDEDVRLMTMCGMSAAFSAVFGTPIAAAIFTLEMCIVGFMQYFALFPCLLSAYTGLFVSKLFNLTPTSLTISNPVDFIPSVIIKTIVLSTLIAILSIGFCEIIHYAAHLFAKKIPNVFLRAIIGGCLILLLSIIDGTFSYNNAGSNLIASAINGNAKPYDFLLKILFTAITLGTGFKGGEIVPVFATGSTFGCIVAPLLGLPASYGAAIGFIGLFCGVTNCPLASVLLAMEVFGGKNIELFAITCAISYTISGYFGLYSEQKIAFSKTGLNEIHRKIGKNN